MRRIARPSIEKRAVACLQGVAVGDATGKMTEGYWPEEVPSTYKGNLDVFIKQKA